ncbi:MAG: hypothetical protein WCF85_12955 [Rhodospirillaceae bacterium]
MQKLIFMTGLLFAASTAATAQDAQPFQQNANPVVPLFECNQKTIGQTGCQARMRCICRYDAFGSTMTGLPPGYRWNCGLEQGNCMSTVPATTTGTYGVAPAPQQLPTPQVIVPYSGGTGTGTGGTGTGTTP